MTGKRNMRYLLGLVAVIASSSTFADETWKCTAPLERKIVVEATAHFDSNTNPPSPLNKGSIRVAGVVHSTTYEVIGFGRVWRFGKNPEFGFKIMPSGEAEYFESKNGFEHLHDRFECKQVK